MLDIKDIRLNTEEYKRRLGTRGVKPEEIDELVAEDKKRRELLVETENLKKERNAFIPCFAVRDGSSKSIVTPKTRLAN